MRDLDHEHLLLLEEGHCLRDQALDVCRLTGANERERLSCDQPGDPAPDGRRRRRQHAVAGTGRCSLRCRRHREIRLLAFRGKAPSRHIAMVWRRSSAMSDFLSQLAEQFRSLPSGLLRGIAGKNGTRGAGARTQRPRDDGTRLDGARMPACCRPSAGGIRRCLRASPPSPRRPRVSICGARCRHAHDPDRPPLQSPLPPALPSFRLAAADLQPLAGFSVDARVLSRRDYTFGREADLSPTDLALGWGRMRDDAVLAHLSISQSARWYRYRWTGTAPLPPPEIAQSSANMHMIPSDASTAAALHRTYAPASGCASTVGWWKPPRPTAGAGAAR